MRAKIINTIAVLSIAILGSACNAFGTAGPDTYKGDTSIYTGAIANIKPNVLIAIDNSAGMSQQAQAKPYDPTVTYTYTGMLYDSNMVYKRVSATGGTINYNAYVALSDVTCTAAKNALEATGYYSGPLKQSDGSCNASQSYNYYLGNLLNYNNMPTPVWAASTAYTAGDIIKPSSGATTQYVCTQTGTSGTTAPSWPTDTTIVTDGTAKWQLYGVDMIGMIKTVVGQVAAGVRDSARLGLMVFGSNNHGGAIRTPVQDIGTGDATQINAYNSFISSLNAITLLTSNIQPVNELVWDGGLYFKGQNSSTDKISSERAAYSSPIQYKCQVNYIIMLTTGNADDNSLTKSYVSDLTGDGTSGLVDDVAYHVYLQDSSTLFGTQRVLTAVIQLFTSKVQRLEDASKAEKDGGIYGRGGYYNVQSANDLTEALQEIMSNIVKEGNTSFVAPVVPVSPENRTYSGSRVYMGFFNPQSNQAFWFGNMKKLGISDTNSQLADKNNARATWVDLEGNGIDDVDNSALPSGTQNGSFRTTCKSYWNDVQDAGIVNDGGVGLLLKNRSIDATSASGYSLSGSDPRKIYTLLDDTKVLTAAENTFTTGNALVTKAMLGLAEADNLNQFIGWFHGVDTYDEDANASTTKRAWVLGDILHSRPLVVNYKSYTLGNEASCTENKSLLYVGADDGMIHAFRDCDGKELWAFIPQDQLINLGDLKKSAAHHYYVDATPVAYIYDANGNGTIDTSTDKVILLFGTRRGSGKNEAPTQGYYYALDVTNPDAPTYLWRFGTDTTGFTEMGESWSEPKLVKMKIGSANKIVMFVGAGYDNINEDNRYGANQYFTGNTSSPSTNYGADNTTSPGDASTTPATQKGRGIYAVEIATLDATTGAPTINTSLTKLWGYTTANNSDMKFSFPGEITAMDFDANGYTDRLYATDTGGNIWRFYVGSTATSGWSGYRIFSANPASGTNVGRKMFYKPSVVRESSYVMVFIGSGDREHPLNTAVVDRLYAIKDRGQTSPKYEADADIVDVTDDLLQTSTDANAVANLLNTLNSSSNFGWYIRLANSGEKVLAPPSVFNKVAYFTTYAPNISGNDPCEPGNLGVSRVYAVDYKTGEAVVNYNINNDTSYESLKDTNARATAIANQVLQASDRIQVMGSGIPSGLVIMITPSGHLEGLLGVGGAISGTKLKKGGSIKPLYWRQK